MGNRLLIQPGAHTGKKRRGDLRIDDHTEPDLEGAKQIKLCGVKLVAGFAGVLVRGNLDGKAGFAGRQRIADFLSTLLAVHRNFSASCFLAKNNLDFTVPMGMPSIPATSSSV